MTITLSPETQKLLEERMKLNGVHNPDDALRAALMFMEENEDDRSLETLAAIQRGLADLDAGRSKSWDEFDPELVARYSQK